MRIERRPYLTYALNNEGTLVHVDDVPNGNKCGCVCPHCKDKLCAKNGGTGEKMIHHFAHLSGADCVGAVETVQHIMAKTALLETKKVCLPNRFDGQKGKLICFDRVEVEFYDKDTKLRPDCIGYYGDNCLWVEFKRTHAVDAKKKGKIISAHIDCIEIDLKDCAIDPNFIKKFIITSSENREWIRDTSFNVKKRHYEKLSDYSYCNKHDDEYYHRHIIREYAKDEDGNLVNVFDDSINMNEHTYYCIACGKELTIDIDKKGGFHFVHVEKNTNCQDTLYLHETAKEIVYYKFYNSEEFVIRVPQDKECIEKTSCILFDKDRCYVQKPIEYNLKEHGYSECIKNYYHPESDFKFDLVIKRSDSFKNAIYISIKSIDDYEETPQMQHRIIDIEVYNESGLNMLLNSPIGEGLSNFLNFRSNKTEKATVSEINRYVKKFELFSSGKYHMSSVTCKKALDTERHNSTIHELILSNEEGPKVTRLLALLQCYNAKMKACYCELCFFLSDNHNAGLERICKRYKTKGTPSNPMSSMPVNCKYFSLNKALVSRIIEESKLIRITNFGDNSPK